MPRTARAVVGGYFYHVINRGNGRAEVFVTRTAALLGLDASHRPIGRPEKLVEM
jgi:REP element-mobilizing transposase RayT